VGIDNGFFIKMRFSSPLKSECQVTTGKLGFYEDLKKQVPQELHELIQIPGIGPKTVQYLHKELGIKSVKELEKAAKEQLSA